MASKNTLAYVSKYHPFNQAFNMSAITVKQVGESLAEYQKTHPGTTQCIAEAVSFYAYNHALLTLSQKYKPTEVIRDVRDLQVLDYYRSATELLSYKRMFFYVLLICFRESRHAGVGLAGLKNIPLDVQYWIKSFSDNAEAGPATFKKPPNDMLKLGDLVQYMQDIFYKLQWSSSYGGKKWGVIADALAHLVKADWTPLMFMDTAFTLAHNGGPIFNKGMFYDNGNYATLMEVLDCQRAGQIPNWILQNKKTPSNSTVTQVLQQAQVPQLTWMAEQYPDKIDWKGVVAAGAVGNYSAHLTKEQQQEAKAKVTPPPALANKNYKPIAIGKAVYAQMTTRSELPGLIIAKKELQHG